MKVILAHNAGFCMGVRRAVETTLDTMQREEQGVATFGPLIHNPQVLDLLAERGVRVLKDIPAQESGTVIIRAHGVPPEQKKGLQNSGARVVDATCPRVVKVQAIIKKYRQQGCATVIIGDRDHAEVEGLMGYAGDTGRVVSCEADIENLALAGPYIIVSQTTQDEEIFHLLSAKITERFADGRVFNTICDSTHKRQEEVRALCRQVEAMVVVGGRNSANTQRLGEIAGGMGRTVFLVETEDELDMAALSKFDCVGVTAGASTPTWLINRVVRTLEAIPARGDSPLLVSARRLLRFVLITNLYVSLAGGLLAYACSLLQGIAPQPAFSVIAFCYIFAMHNINRFTDEKTKKFNDPVRSLFYRQYRWALLGLSALALAAALTLASGLGQRSFALLAGMSLLGILYSVRFIPRALLPVLRIRRLKEIPGSKTFFVAMAWGFVTTLVPAWGDGNGTAPATLGVLVVVFLLVYVRSALFDCFEVQGDRIVGKETLPVCIGEKKTLSILFALQWLLAGLLLALPLLGGLTPVAYWLLPGVGYSLYLSRLYAVGRMRPGPKLEFLLESLFVFLALLAWLGSRFHAVS